MELYRNNEFAISGYTAVSDRAYTAVIGVALLWGLILTAAVNKFFGTTLVMMNPLVVLVAYLAMVFAGSFMTRSGKLGLCILGYHLIVVPLAAVISIELTAYGYDASIVTRALGMTIGIAALMTGISSIFPRVFLNIGPALGIAFIVSFIVSIIAGFFSTAVYGVLDYVIVVIFSLYVGFDWARAGRMERTIPNAIYSATQIFVDLVNIFLRILRITGRSRRSS